MEKVAVHLKTTLLPFFAISLILLPLLQATSVRYCDRKFYPVKVHGVDISPDPVVSGNPATFTISASADQAISSGKLVIDVSYFGVHVHKETHDLCEEASCPIAVGDFVLSHTQTLPGFTPPGLYTLKMTLEDERNQQLTCISFSFKIGLGSSVSDS
ncbi:hypothetical protein SLEP1_g43341 [Rubroshorea leprosula]|uniref:MD-2-related lipid-recognition domain-containing protein n=1 Tax=Rubroshorea leprosula TaxID=152421 RepID=A0AAV5LDQ8_9ROSI|nr:hypothetical protein SLEP1_g43341 [Rubroshorea leprosula]